MSVGERGLAGAVAGLALYFGLVLVPNWWPSLLRADAYWLYQFSVLLMLPCLLVLVACGASGAAWARWRGRPVGWQLRAFVVLSIAGFLFFAATMLIDHYLRRGLPTGSYVREFDPVAWGDPRSSDIVIGDITPRQKMLGSVVAQLSPRQDRRQLEALLGPSDDAKLVGTDRELIYPLGPERRPFGFDYEWMLIQLDESGHFERYTIHDD